MRQLPTGDGAVEATVVVARDLVLDVIVAIVLVVILNARTAHYCPVQNLRVGPIEVVVVPVAGSWEISAGSEV